MSIPFPFLCRNEVPAPETKPLLAHPVVLYYTQVMNTYQPTHVSVRDDSTAMIVSRNEETITLVNEDGEQWTDPVARWKDIACCDPAWNEGTNDIPGRDHDHTCDNYDGAPVEQWEVTTPDEVYMTDDMYDERDTYTSGEQFYADYINSDSYINYLNG